MQAIDVYVYSLPYLHVGIPQTSLLHTLHDEPFEQTASTVGVKIDCTVQRCNAKQWERQDDREPELERAFALWQNETKQQSAPCSAVVGDVSSASTLKERIRTSVDHSATQVTHLSSPRRAKGPTSAQQALHDATARGEAAADSTEPDPRGRHKGTIRNINSGIVQRHVAAHATSPPV